MTGPTAVKVGDVIDVAPGTHVPRGLLAKVTAVNGRVLSATAATLQQAIPRGEFTTSASFSPAVAGTADGSAPRPAPQPAARQSEVSLKCGASGAVKAAVTTAFTVHPTETFQWNGSGGLQVVAALAVTGRVGITASIGAKAKCSFDLDLNPVNLATKVIKVGKALKLVLYPGVQLKLKGEVETDSAESLSAAEKVSGTVGIRYADGELSATDSLTATPSYTPPHADGTGSVELTVGPTATLTMFSRQILALNADFGVRLDAAKDGLPTWVLDGVVKAGGAVNFWKFSKSNQALIDRSFPITHAAARAPGGLDAVACPSASVCEATSALNGGVEVFRSTDGGELWVPQALPNGVTEINAVACPTAQRCYAAAGIDGYADMLGTSDGGAKWTATSLGSSATIPLGLSCPTASRCVTSGYEGFEVTTDGGTDWMPVAAPGDVTPEPVACPSASLCYATGEDAGGGGSAYADVLRSTDGGLIWTSKRVGYQGTADSIACPSKQQCVAFGADADLNHYVIRIVNGGGSWTDAKMPAGTAHGVGSLACPTAKVCVSVAGQGAIRSADGGRTWTTAPVPAGAGKGVPVAIACRSASACEVVGAYLTGASSDDMMAAATDNGGRSWDVQLP